MTDPCPNSAGIDGRNGLNDNPCPDFSDGGWFDNDNIDNCPNEAGPESNGGCKLDDIDNDGIPNIDDNCPNEAGDKRFGGCPKIPISLSCFLNNNSEIFI